MSSLEFLSHLLRLSLYLFSLLCHTAQSVLMPLCKAVILPLLEAFLIALASGFLQDLDPGLLDLCKRFLTHLFDLRLRLGDQLLLHRSGLLWSRAFLRLHHPVKALLFADDIPLAVADQLRYLDSADPLCEAICKIRLLAALHGKLHRQFPESCLRPRIGIYNSCIGRVYHDPARF